MVGSDMWKMRALVQNPHRKCEWPIKKEKHERNRIQASQSIFFAAWRHIC